MIKTIEDLEAFNPCKDGLEWAKTQPSLPSVWNNCERGDWIWWIVIKVVKPEKEISIKFANFCSERAKKYSDAAAASYAIAYAAANPASYDADAASYAITSADAADTTYYAAADAAFAYADAYVARTAYAAANDAARASGYAVRAASSAAFATFFAAYAAHADAYAAYAAHACAAHADAHAARAAHAESSLNKEKLAQAIFIRSIISNPFSQSL